MTSARELSVEQQPHARVFRRASPPARLNLPPFASPTVVVTPPPMPGAEKGYMEAGGHGSGAGTPGSGYEPHRDEARKELGHVHEVDDSLPTEYLGRILAFQLVFRTVAAAVYLAGTLEWYTYHRWPSMLAYWTYWIPAHYAAMNALRTGRRRAWTALGFALLSHAIEGFVLINVVYNPEVWGARKLRYLVLPVREAFLHSAYSVADQPRPRSKDSPAFS